MAPSDRLARSQTDDLLLLVGSNPLPNAVAALLLVKEQGTVHLLYSQASKPVADRLKIFLERRLQPRQARVKLLDRAVQEFVPAHVAGVTSSWWKDLSPNRSVGIHYTGGTKVMSVQAYRAPRSVDAAPSARPTHPGPVIYSYLDPDTLSLYVERDGKGETVATRNLEEARLNVSELLTLHGGRVAPVEVQNGTHQDIVRQALTDLGYGASMAQLRTGVHVPTMKTAVFDALVVVGYQLFAFVSPHSASREKAKQQLKKDLFRAYEQARRLGGDEARAALVYSRAWGVDPATLQDELCSDFDLPANKPGYREQAKALYAEDVAGEATLSDRIAAWIAQERQERESVRADDDRAMCSTMDGSRDEKDKE